MTAKRVVMTRHSIADIDATSIALSSTCVDAAAKWPLLLRVYDRSPARRTPR